MTADVQTPKTSYQYVVLRCVPRVEREEFINVGVVLYAQATNFLAAAWRTDPQRLAALDPRLDLERVHRALHFIEAVCAADPRIGAPATPSPGQRFGFIKAPRSTILQPGPVHGGVTDDPARQLDHLLHCLVG